MMLTRNNHNAIRIASRPGRARWLAAYIAAIAIALAVAGPLGGLGTPAPVGAQDGGTEEKPTFVIRRLPPPDGIQFALNSSPSWKWERHEATYGYGIVNGQSANFAIAMYGTSGSGGANVDEPLITVRISSDSEAISGITPDTLTFTAGNWGDLQKVRFSHTHDVNADGSTVTVTLTASGEGRLGGRYDGTTQVSFKVVEPDRQNVIFAGPLTQYFSRGTQISEGSSATYTAALLKHPGNDGATVNISSRYDDVTVAPNTLTFTKDNWSIPQTVKATIAEDSNTAHELAELLHSIVGPTVGSAGWTTGLLFYVSDNDKTWTEGRPNGPPVVKPGSIKMTEGSSSKLTITPAGQPYKNTTTIVGIYSNSDEAITVSPATLTFTVDNWSTPQTVAVNAAKDKDDKDNYYVLRIGAATDFAATHPSGPVLGREWRRHRYSHHSS